MKVAEKVTKSVFKNVKAVKSGVFTNVDLVKSGVKDMFSCQNALACFIALLVVAYIVLVTPATSLDFFATVPGKLISMVVLIMALAIDMRLGVLVAIALALSISFASFNSSVESFVDTSEDALLESSEDEALLESSEDDVETSEDDDVDVDPAAAPIVDEEDAEAFSDYAPANF